MDEEIYGIDKELAHQRAIELISEAFFWDCVVVALELVIVIFAGYICKHT